MSARGKRAFLAKAAEHADTAIRSLRQAIAEPVNEVWDHHGENAVRYTRLAAYYAFRARPELKDDSYARAVAEWKAGPQVMKARNKT